MGKRAITYQEQGDSLEILIPTPKVFFMMIFLPVWLVGWAFGEYTVARGLITGVGGNSKAFMVIWLLGWTAGGIFAAYAWLWGVAGKERVTISPISLSIKKDLFGKGRTRSFPITEVSDLRASGYFPRPMSWQSTNAMWGISGGAIAFEHLAKTYRFGILLQEKEAKDVASAIETWLSRHS